MAGLKRPTSVTVIAIIIIVFNGLGLVATLASTGNPAVQQAYEKMGVSVAFVVGMTLVSSAVFLAAAIGMLMRHNWARLLYLVGIPVSIVIGWLVFGFNPFQLVGVALYVVFLILLTRPKVNDYFAGVAPPEPVPPPMPVTPEAPPVPESTEPPETPEE